MAQGRMVLRGGDRVDIAIAGAGYVGLTSAACLCELGHQVRLVEINPERLKFLRSGQCPIYEPGLAELLHRHLARSLTVVDALHGALVGAAALIICVGTPPRANGAPDLGSLKRLLKDMRQVPDLSQTIVVLKSTAPPGTCRMASEMLGGRTAVVSNPEFLREGTAIHDFFHPDRIVVGGPDEQANLTVAGLYRGVDAPLLVTGWEEAELVKYSTNAFLALKISYANEIAVLCEAIGADAGEVLQGLGLDTRVGPQFLRPGPGYGGSCLPKDIQALVWRARKAGVRFDLVPSAERVNRRQKDRLFRKLESAVAGLAGKTVAIWGLAFKAGTDDLRSSAALDLVPRIVRAGARVQAYDPAAMNGFGRIFTPAKWPAISLGEDHMSVLDGADALLVLTEWDLFRTVPAREIAMRMAGRTVVDARNLLDPEEVVQAGFAYQGIGRGRLR